MALRWLISPVLSDLRQNWEVLDIIKYKGEICLKHYGNLLSGLSWWRAEVVIVDDVLTTGSGPNDGTGGMSMRTK